MAAGDPAIPSGSSSTTPVTSSAPCWDGTLTGIFSAAYCEGRAIGSGLVGTGQTTRDGTPTDGTQPGCSGGNFIDRILCNIRGVETDSQGALTRIAVIIVAIVIGAIVLAALIWYLAKKILP